MAYIKKIVAVIALCAVLSAAFAQVSQGGPHTSQGDPHQNQGRARRQASPVQIGEDNQDRDWTTCDLSNETVFSCHDCNTRLKCTPKGIGVLIQCRNPFKPYCNNGFCSNVPSAECA